MKRLLSYKEFISENYLPYFGVKQAIDDSYFSKEEKPMLKEKTSDFTRIYSMTPEWWEAWKRENEQNFQIIQDAFSKTYEVKKDENTVFVFDYGRNKVFTNEKPDIFRIKQEITPEELEKIKSVDIEDPNQKKEKMEEDLQTDPNRTVGTGTYTPTFTYPNSITGGFFNSTDSASGGTTPVYTS